MPKIVILYSHNKMKNEFIPLESALKIKKVRNLVNIRQQSVADFLHIEQNTYSKIENGLVKLSKDRFSQICNFLGVTEDFVENFSSKDIISTINNYQTGGETNGVKFETEQSNKLIEIIDKLTKNVSVLMLENSKLIELLDILKKGK